VSRAGARRATGLVCALAFVTTWLVLSCRSEPKASGRPVDAVPAAPKRIFLVTIDTLRADHLSAYGYARQTSPTLDAWAASGRTFEHAIAQWPKTGSSFASMFTGRYPQTTGLMHSAAIRIPAEITTLPELLQRSGYRTAAVVSNPVLTKRLGWDRGFDEYLETWSGAELPEGPDSNRPLFQAARVNALASPLLERHAADDKLFVWLHYTDPHAPYILPPGVENPFLGDSHDTGERRVELAESSGKLIGEERALRYYVAQYDANVLYTDGKIHEILERARTLGLLADAAVIFTADHGESLGEHDSYFEHGPLAYNTTLRVPLIFAFPGLQLAPARIRNPVELIDLYPTLHEWLAPAPEVAGLEGQSLLPFLAAAPPSADAVAAFRVAFAGAGKRSPYTHYRTVQDERWKLIFLPPTRGVAAAPGWELYDLLADPLETQNLATAETEQLRRLRRDLLSWIQEDRPNVQDEATLAKNDREVRQALKALGYIP
jgi:arylsulfatase A-like enzyme